MVSKKIIYGPFKYFTYIFVTLKIHKYLVEIIFFSFINPKVEFFDLIKRGVKSLDTLSLQ